MNSDPLSHAGAGMTAAGVWTAAPGYRDHERPPSVEICAVLFALHTTALEERRIRYGDCRGD